MSQGTAVLMDFDDTILATSESRRPLFTEHLQRFGATAERIALMRQSWGVAFNEAVRIAAPDIDYSAFIESYAAQMRITLPLACEGAGTFLKTVAARNVPIVVISSSIRLLIEVDLELLGFTDFIDSIFAADDVKYQKPDPRVLHPAREHLNRVGYSLDESVFIGDSLGDYRCSLGQCEFIAVLSGLTKRQEFIGAGLRERNIASNLTDALELLSEIGR
jgi:phosphoglycolate phosphatase-like HAD superfamily hydrolase